MTVMTPFAITGPPLLDGDGDGYGVEQDEDACDTLGMSTTG